MARGQVDTSNPPLGVCRLPVWSSTYSPSHQPTTAQLYPGLGTLTAVSPQLPPCRGQLMHCLWCLPSSPPSRVPCSEFAFQGDIPFAHILSQPTRTCPIHAPIPSHVCISALALLQVLQLSLSTIQCHLFFFPFLILQITPTWQQKSQHLLISIRVWTPYPNSQL